MTVGNAFSSYCYSILLTVLCSLVLASTSPLITPTHASDSQSNKGKSKHHIQKLHFQSWNSLSQRCCLIHSLSVDFSHCPKSSKISSKQDKVIMLVCVCVIFLMPYATNIMYRKENCQ